MAEDNIILYIICGRSDNKLGQASNNYVYRTCWWSGRRRPRSTCTRWTENEPREYNIKEIWFLRQTGFNITLDGNEMMQADGFVYLGGMVIWRMDSQKYTNKSQCLEKG